MVWRGLGETVDAAYVLGERLRRAFRLRVRALGAPAYFAFASMIHSLSVFSHSTCYVYAFIHENPFIRFSSYEGALFSSSLIVITYPQESQNESKS